MKIYRIAGGTFAAGVGTRLLLLAAQAEIRRHNLEPYKEVEGAALVTTKAVVEFKAGEVLGIGGDLPKSMAHLVSPVEGRVGRKSSEGILLRALEAIEEEAAKAALAAERRAAETARQVAQREREDKAWSDEFAASPELQLKFTDVAAYIAARRDPPKA